MSKVRRKVARLISIVYFLQGALGISSIAVPLYLRSSDFSIRDIAFYNSIVVIPWFFKIIYGIISDSYPIFELRRKPYLFIAAFFGGLGWFLMAIVPPKMLFLAVSMMIANLGFAMIDVVTDGIVVEHSNARNAQVYQSISWGMRSLGAVMSGVLGGYLAASIDYRLIFLMTVFFPVAAGIAAIFYEEEKVTALRSANAFDAIKKSFQHLMAGDLRWFCLLLFIFSLASSFFTPLFFHMRETLHFDEKFLGLLGSATWVGAAIGCFFYLRFLKRLPLKRALRMAVIVGFFEILFCLWLHDHLSALIIFVSAGILGYVSLLPLSSTAAKLAHKTGVESSLFAILMGIFSLGQAVSTFAGGWLSEKIGIYSLIILTALCTLSGFTVIKKLKTL